MAVVNKLLVDNILRTQKIKGGPSFNISCVPYTKRFTNSGHVLYLSHPAYLINYQHFSYYQGTTG